MLQHFFEDLAFDGKWVLSICQDLLHSVERIEGILFLAWWCLCVQVVWDEDMMHDAVLFAVLGWWRDPSRLLELLVVGKSKSVIRARRKQCDTCVLPKVAARGQSVPIVFCVLVKGGNRAALQVRASK